MFILPDLLVWVLLKHWNVFGLKYLSKIIDWKRFRQGLDYTAKSTVERTMKTSGSERNSCDIYIYILKNDGNVLVGDPLEAVNMCLLPPSVHIGNGVFFLLWRKHK